MTILSHAAGLRVACLLGALVVCSHADAQLRTPALAAADRVACEQEAQLLFPPRFVTRVGRAEAGQPTAGRHHDLNWGDRRAAEHRCQVARRQIVARG